MFLYNDMSLSQTATPAPCRYSSMPPVLLNQVAYVSAYKDPKKQFKCRFVECGRNYSSEDTRRRHYRKHHAEQWSTVRRCKENTIVKKEQERKNRELERGMSLPVLTHKVRLLPKQHPYARTQRQHSLPMLQMASSSDLTTATPRPLYSARETSTSPMPFQSTQSLPNFSQISAFQSTPCFSPNSTSVLPPLPSLASIMSQTSGFDVAENTLGSAQPLTSSPEPDQLLLELQSLIDNYAK